jgi:hypothetical protein
MYSKRLGACLLGGAVSALVCLIGAQIIHGNPPISWETVSYTMANRVLLGFIIGLSAWHLHYLLHGALLGLIVSLSISIAFVARPMDFALYTAAGVVYGLFIEFFATRIFRAPMMRPYAP